MLKMQSTPNYLWNTDDVLGQGATASVYKARSKVSEGHRTGNPAGGKPELIRLFTGSTWTHVGSNSIPFQSVQPGGSVM